MIEQLLFLFLCEKNGAIPFSIYMGDAVIPGLFGDLLLDNKKNDARSEADMICFCNTFKKCKSR